MDLETTFVEELPVKLTERERLERADQASDLGEQIVALKAELKQQQADGKRAVDQLEAKFTHLWKVVHARQERRPVECIQRVNGQHERLEKVRTDTGEVFSSRPLTPDELRQIRQPSLPLRFQPEALTPEVVAEAEALGRAAERFKGKQRVRKPAHPRTIWDLANAIEGHLAQEPEHDENGEVPPSEPPGPVMSASGLPETATDEAEPEAEPDEEPPPTSSIPDWEGDDESWIRDGADGEPAADEDPDDEELFGS